MWLNIAMVEEILKENVSLLEILLKSAGMANYMS